MSIANTVQDLNRQLARRINEEARSNPQSPYANKFVGIANGQVVAVADNLDEMTRQLRQAESDPRKCFWVEASRDYDEVHDILGADLMPRAEWPLRQGRPCLEVVLTLAAGGQPLPRMLLADTGAGSQTSGIDLLLDEDGCLLCGGLAGASVSLGGAYVGSFPLYDLFVQLPALGFAQNLQVVGMPTVPAGFNGLACFGFLNCFQYGNFGDSGVFGLEL